MKYAAPYGVSDPDASYVNGDPSNGREGSIPPAQAFEQNQRELQNIVVKTGQTPSNTDNLQVAVAVRSGVLNFAEDLGTTNHLVVRLDPRPTEFFDGMPLRVRIAHTNSGPVDLEVIGPNNEETFGPMPVKRNDLSDLVIYDIGADMIGHFAWDAVHSCWQLVALSVDALLYAGGVSGGVSGDQVPGPPGPKGDTGAPGPASGLHLWIRVDAGTYTFTVPAGITRLYGKAVGAGGGGSSQAQGGDGTVAEGGFDVTPGQNITVIVGLGGDPTNESYTAGIIGSGPVAASKNGGTTSIGAYLTAPGGNGAAAGGYFGGAYPTGIPAPPKPPAPSGGQWNHPLEWTAGSYSWGGGSYSVPVTYAGNLGSLQGGYPDSGNTPASVTVSGGGNVSGGAVLMPADLGIYTAGCGGFSTNYSMPGVGGCVRNATFQYSVMSGLAGGNWNAVYSMFGVGYPTTLWPSLGRGLDGAAMIWY